MRTESRRQETQAGESDAASNSNQPTSNLHGTLLAGKKWSGNDRGSVIPVGSIETIPERVLSLVASFFELQMTEVLL